MEQKPTAEQLYDRLTCLIDDDNVQCEEFGVGALAIHGYISTYDMNRLFKEFDQHFLTPSELVISDFTE